MSKVLVTGSTGFVGLHLVDALLHQGYDVRCLVRPTSRTKSLTKLRAKPRQLEVREVISLSNPKYISHIVDVLKGVDQVFHLAAATHGSKEELYHSNVDTTQNLLTACMNSNISRLNFVSSIAARATKDENEPISSSTPFNAVSNYGKSKLESEKLVVDSRIPFTVYAPSVVVGEGDNEMKPVYQLIRDKGVIFKVGLKDQRLSFINVNDLAGAIVSGSRVNDTLGKCYVLSDGKEHSQTEYLKLIGKSLGRPNLQVYPLPTSLVYLAAGALDAYSVIADYDSMLSLSKVNELKRSWICAPSKDFMHDTNWRPKVSLEESVERTARWLYPN